MIERIDTEAGFVALREEWNELLARSEAATPFLTWEWLHAWWNQLGRSFRLHILAVRSGGRLQAVAPLVDRGWEPVRLRLFRCASFLGAPMPAGNVGSDYLDVFTAPDAAGALEEIAEALAAEGRVLELAQVSSQGSNAERLVERLATGGWRLQRDDRRDACPWIDLDGHDWESYLATRGSEHRYAVQRKLRKLNRDFTVRFDLVATDEERRQALGQLIELHEKRWREKGDSNAFHTPALRAFHDDFTRRALENGWLRLYVLRLDGAPAAAFYALRYGDTYSFFQSGFDPAYARHSVGLVTMALSIQAAIGEGARRYDMLHGTEEYKFHWANATRPLARYVVFPPRLKGALARGLTGVYTTIRPMARRVLDSP
jgi:CelD/BcsL family acetyltransferase involved in cellulose biosynthesis